MRPRAWGQLSLLGVGAFLAGVARGQDVVSVNQLGGELGGSFSGSWFREPGLTGQRGLLWSEWLDLWVTGVAPRQEIASFRAELRPTRQQQRAADGFAPAGQNWSILGFDADVSLLSVSRLPITVRGTRLATDQQDAFGTQVRHRFHQLAAGTELRNPYAPLRVEYQTRTEENIWNPSVAEPFRRRFSTRTARLSAANSKTGLFLERWSYRDRIGQTTTTMDRGQFQNAFRWGKGSRLETGLEYLHRTGGLALESGRWIEQVRLQHTQRVGTDLRYSLASIQANGVRTRQQLAEAAVVLEVRSGIRARAALSSHTVGYQHGSESLLRAAPQLDYRIPLPFRATLSGTVSLGYDRFVLQPGTDTWVTVVDGQHVVGPSRIVALPNTYIDSTSVLVSSLDRGVIYDAGLDYQLLVGEPFSRLVILPAGRIVVGDTVLVSYRYRLFPESRDRALTQALRVVLALPLVQLYHTRTRRDAAGGEGVWASPLGTTRLSNFDEVAFGGGLTFVRRGHSLGVSAERREQTVGPTTATVSSLRGTLSARPLGSLRGTAEAGLSRQAGSGIAYDVVSWSGAVEWFPAPSLRVGGTLGSWRSEVRERVVTSLVGGALDAAWRIGLTRLDVRYFRQFPSSGRGHSENRLSVRLVRTL